MQLVLVVTAFVAFICLSVFAQQNEDIKVFKHPLTDMPGSAEDVATTFYFPSHGDLKLPIGEVVTTLCHFLNKGGGYYNISAVMGSLNAPFDFRHHFQNYSYKPIGMVVRSDEEITMQYSFQLHPDLEPVDYQLAITVFYESETESFSSTFFNQTVELYSPVSDYDFETITSVVSSLLTTFIVGLIAIFACFPETKTSQKISAILRKVLPTSTSTSNKTSGGNDSDDQDDWTIVQHRNNKKQRQSKRSTDEDNEEDEE